jgi:hypothetical protein
VLVHVKDWVTPANGTAKWSEFVQCDQGGVPTAMWRRMPSHMLGKVAESMALRRAFPDVIDPAVADTYPAGVDEDDVELAELLEASAANVTEDPPAPNPAGGPAGPDPTAPRTVTADWTPGPGDQTEAHRTIAVLREPERDLFLRQWDIEDFGDVWPAGAVADALGIELEATS